MCIYYKHSVYYDLVSIHSHTLNYVTAVFNLFDVYNLHTCTCNYYTLCTCTGNLYSTCSSTMYVYSTYMYSSYYIVYTCTCTLLTCTVVTI